MAASTSLESLTPPPLNGELQELVNKPPHADGTTNEIRPKQNPPATKKSSTNLHLKKTIGEIDDVICLYKTGKSVCQCCPEWDERKPFNDDERCQSRHEEAETKHAAYAIVHRQSAHGNPVQWQTVSIEINSPWIEKALGDVFEGYPGVETDVPRLEFAPPFLPFTHRWDRFCEKVKRVGTANNDGVETSGAPSAGDSAGKQSVHLGLLKSILHGDVERNLSILARMEKSGFIAFSDLPLAFVPGEAVLRTSGDTIIAGELTAAYFKKRMDDTIFIAAVDIVEWDGEIFGKSSEAWVVPEFKGYKRITSLNVYPLSTHPDHETLKKDLIERGRKVEKFQGISHRSYSGVVRASTGANWFNPAPERLVSTRRILPPY